MEWYAKEERRIMSRFMSVTLALGVAVGLLLGGCSSLPTLPPVAELPSLPESTPQQTPPAYTIGAKDILSITVYDHQDLTKRVEVAADGSFSYPLVGEIQAAKLSARQLEKRLAEALSEYIVAPQVSVTVEQIQSQQVRVVGEVKAPGIYALRPASTLLEIVGDARGPTIDAGLEVIVVRAYTQENDQRDGGGQDGTRSFHVDLGKLLAGDMTQNIQIYSGDTVYVPTAGFFYVLGEVTRPGRYKLEHDTTIAKAISVAGGQTRFAALNRMKIQRLVEGQRQEFRVQMTDTLQANDVLIIPESFF
jgi:polysaccharide export outer membrane protein